MGDTNHPQHGSTPSDRLNNARSLLSPTSPRSLSVTSSSRPSSRSASRAPSRSASRVPSQSPSRAPSMSMGHESPSSPPSSPGVSACSPFASRSPSMSPSLFPTLAPPHKPTATTTTTPTPKSFHPVTFHHSHFGRPAADKDANNGSGSPIIAILKQALLPGQANADASTGSPTNTTTIEAATGMASFSRRRPTPGGSGDSVAGVSSHHGGSGGTGVFSAPYHSEKVQTRTSYRIVTKDPKTLFAERELRRQEIMHTGLNSSGREPYKALGEPSLNIDGLVMKALNISISKYKPSSPSRPPAVNVRAGPVHVATTVTSMLPDPNNAISGRAPASTYGNSDTHGASALPSDGFDELRARLVLSRSRLQAVKFGIPLSEMMDGQPQQTMGMRELEAPMSVSHTAHGSGDHPSHTTASCNVQTTSSEHQKDDHAGGRSSTRQRGDRRITSTSRQAYADSRSFAESHRRHETVPQDHFSAPGMSTSLTPPPRSRSSSPHRAAPIASSPPTTTSTFAVEEAVGGCGRTGSKAPNTIVLAGSTAAGKTTRSSTTTSNRTATFISSGTNAVAAMTTEELERALSITRPFLPDPAAIMHDLRSGFQLQQQRLGEELHEELDLVERQRRSVINHKFKSFEIGVNGNFSTDLEQMRHKATIQQSSERSRSLAMHPWYADLMRMVLGGAGATAGIGSGAGPVSRVEESTQSSHGGGGTALQPVLPSPTSPSSPSFASALIAGDELEGALPSSFSRGTRRVPRGSRGRRAWTQGASGRFQSQGSMRRAVGSEGGSGENEKHALRSVPGVGKTLSDPERVLLQRLRFFLGDGVPLDKQAFVQLMHLVSPSDFMRDDVQRIFKFLWHRVPLNELDYLDAIECSGRMLQPNTTATTTTATATTGTTTAAAGTVSPRAPISRHLPVESQPGIAKSGSRTLVEVVKVSPGSKESLDWTGHKEGSLGLISASLMEEESSNIATQEGRSGSTTVLAPVIITMTPPLPSLPPMGSSPPPLPSISVV